MHKHAQARNRHATDAHICNLQNTGVPIRKCSLTHARTNTHERTHKHAHTNAHTNMHTHTHTHTHTHKHAAARGAALINVPVAMAEQALDHQPHYLHAPHALTHEISRAAPVSVTTNNATSTFSEEGGAGRVLGDEQGNFNSSSRSSSSSSQQGVEGITEWGSGGGGGGGGGGIVGAASGEGGSSSSSSKDSRESLVGGPNSYAALYTYRVVGMVLKTMLEVLAAADDSNVQLRRWFREKGEREAAAWVYMPELRRGLTGKKAVGVLLCCVR